MGMSGLSEVTDIIQARLWLTIALTAARPYSSSWCRFRSAPNQWSGSIRLALYGHVRLPVESQAPSASAIMPPVV